MRIRQNGQRKIGAPQAQYRQHHHRCDNGSDTTQPGDYYADTDDPRVQADLEDEDLLTKGEPKVT